MPQSHPGAPSPPLWETLKQDWRYVRDEVRPGWRGSFRKTIAELEEFYLTPDERQSLAKMNRFWRSMSLGWRLLKSLFFKLSPARRVLFVAALLLLVSGRSGFTLGSDNVSGGVQLATVGGLLLVALLLLELKDKLLARHELEAGRAVQRALMPERCPSLEGWDVWMYTRPANDVGGDLVDCLEIAPGRVSFALADVAGKALPAALLMAKVQSTLRALATEVPSLSALAARTNTILCRDGLPNRFATMVYLEARHNSGTLRLVNAGHMPPVKITGATFHDLPRGSMALGMMPAATYDEQEIDLQPGELLVVYSDGLTEALNEAGDFYGEDRMREVFPTLAGLSAREAGARLLASVDAFIGDTRPYDDLSLVILKRT